MPAIATTGPEEGRNWFAPDPMPAEPLPSLAAVARALDAAPDVVRRWGRVHGLRPLKTAAGFNLGAVVNVLRAVEARRHATLASTPTAQARREREGGGMEAFRAARTRKALADAARAEMDLAVRRGEYFTRESVETAVVETMQIVSECLTGIAERLDPPHRSRFLPVLEAAAEEANRRLGAVHLLTAEEAHVHDHAAR